MNFIHTAQAQNPFDNALQQVDQSTTTVGAYKNRGDLTTTLGVTIQILLGLVGLVLLISMVYAGLLWMFGFGDSTDKIDKAKSIIKYSVVGLAVILIAYSLTTYIFTLLK